MRGNANSVRQRLVYNTPCLDRSPPSTHHLTVASLALVIIMCTQEQEREGFVPLNPCGLAVAVATGRQRSER